jgi:hypothetical protein
MPWFLLLALSLVLGLAPSPRWTIAVAPMLCLALGAVAELRHPRSYDMHGLAFAVGVLVAALSLLGWGGARLLARIWR